MTIDRSERITFEEVADLYAEVRPEHPKQLVEDVLALSGIPEGGRILEIGPGPGNATLPFARRGYQILGIELGRRLAAIASSNCRAYPGVEIRNIAFEDWELEPRAYDLVLSADAFHWIPPEIGYPKAAEALRDSGSAAFIWSVPVDPQTDWSQAVNAVYQEVAPQINNPDRSFSLEWLTGIIKGNFEASNAFSEVILRQYNWTESMTGEHYIKLLRTYSRHRRLDKGTREALYTGIQEVLEKYGGVVQKPHQEVLFLSKVKR